MEASNPYADPDAVRRQANNPVVYAIQEDSSKNMVSALEYGSVEALLQEREEATMLNIPTIVAKLKYGPRNFRPQDYLILIGNPASIGIACAIASHMAGGDFNVLKWDKQERRYWKARVNIHQGE